MNFYICANSFTHGQISQARECIEKLEALGNACFVSEETSALLYGDGSRVLKEIERCDLILSLGGDGALLKAAKTAIDADKPLLGINSGRLGFLCAMSFDEVDHFDTVFKECVLSERSLLSLEQEGKRHIALNDVVISKGDFGKTVDLSFETEDGNRIDVRGDGLIICTPTGSTAYNLSAGGPRILGDTPVFAVTPICPHDKNSYSRVIYDENRIRVYVNHESAKIYCDGEYVLETSESVTVKKSDRHLHLYMRK